MQAIGYFMTTPELSYSPAQAGRVSEVSVSWLSNQDVPAGTDMIVYLPDFASDGLERSSVISIKPYCKFAKAMWSSSRNLKVTFGSPLSGKEIVSVVVRPEVGVMLPANRIPTQLSYSGHRIEMLGTKTKIFSTPIGSIDHTQLCLTSLYVNRPISVSIVFFSSIPLVLNDAVAAYLPGFFAPSGASTAQMYKSQEAGCESQREAIAPSPSATWDSTTSILRFSITAESEPNVYIHLQLMNVLGMSRVGIVPNSPDYWIQIFSSSPVSPTAILISPGAGHFQVSRLGFYPLLSNEPSELSLSFQLSSKLDSRDRIIVYLPGFSRCDDETGCPATFNVQGPDGVLFKHAEWFPFSVPPSLQLFVSEDITAGRYVQLVLHKSSDIRLPTDGVRGNLASLMISTDANAGEVPPTSILETAPVGSFEKSEQLSFEPAVAGSVVSVIFSFVSASVIEKNAKLELLLRGFQRVGGPRRDNETLSVAANVSGKPMTLVKNVLWSTINQTLSMHFGQAVEANVLIQLFIVASNGLRIPEDGLEGINLTNSKCVCDEQWIDCGCADLLYRLSSQISPIHPRPIETTPVVGQFLNSSLSFVEYPENAPLVPARDGDTLLVTVKIVFRLSRRIRSGEIVTIYLPRITNVKVDIATSSTTVDISGLDSQYFQEGRWNSEQSVLVLQATQSVPAKQMIELQILSAEGFQLPFDGILLNDLNYKIATNAMEGPVLPIAMQEIQPVGSFLGETSLTFGRALVGLPTTVIIRFRASMNILKGEVVRLSLPGFGGSYGAEMPYTTKSGIRLFASWSGSGSTLLSLTAASTIAAYDPFEVHISPTSAWTGITLPSRGTYQNQVDHTLETDAIDGPVFPTPFLVTQAITGFDAPASSLNLGLNPFAGKLSDVYLTFTLQRALYQGDTITARLPGFQQYCVEPYHPVDNSMYNLTYVGVCNSSRGYKIGANYSFRIDAIPLNMSIPSNSSNSSDPLQKFQYAAILDVSSDSASSNFSTYWSNRDQALTIVPSQNVSVAAQTLIEVSIPVSRSFGLQVPAFGLRKQSHGIVLAVDSILGIADPTSVTHVQSVGFISGFPTISFDPPRFGSATDITLVCRPEMTLVAGDRLRVALPDFVGPGRGVIENLVGRSASFFTPTWTPAGSPPGSPAELLFEVKPGKTFNAGGVINVTVMSSAGIKIPQLGIRSTSRLNLTIEAVDGPIFQKPLNFTAIGSLGAEGSLRIDFAPAVAGMATQISVAFSVPMGILTGEKCYLEVPGFTRNLTRFPVDSRSPLQLQNPGDFLTSWLQKSARSVIEISAAKYQLGPQQVVLTVENGIRLPFEGVSASSDPMIFWCDTSEGAIPRTSVAVEKAIGRFFPGTSISFIPALAGLAAQLTFSFQFSENAHVGDKFTWALPEFVARGSGPIPLSGQDFSLFRPAHWNETRSEMTVTAKLGWQKLRVISFSIQTLAESGPTGFTLPARGILAGVQSITISTDAKGGAVAPIPVDRIPAIGSFGSLTKLNFNPPIANAMADVVLSFVPTMSIRTGESVTVSFRGMAVVDIEADTVSEPQNPYVLRSQVFPNEVLTVMRYIVPSPGFNAGANVSIVFPRIRIPVDGIGSGYRGLLVSTNAHMGSVDHSKIQNWQLVGAFLETSINFPLPEAGDSVLNIDLSFSAEMRISPGEIIQVTLNGFGGNSQDLEVQSEPAPGKITAAQWDETTFTITITVGIAIEAREGIKIKITKSTIAMPAAGFNADGSSPMLISTNAVAGPILPVQIESISAVGVISDSSLDFGNPVAGEYSSLTIGFRVSSTVTFGDEVIVILPSIVRDTAQKTFFTQSKFWSDARWDARKSTLSLKAVTSSIAGQLFAVTIDEEENFKIPSVGIQLTSNNFLIRSLAVSGPTLAQQFQNVTAVGSFTNSTVMVFEDLAQVFSGRAATFSICFAAQATIAAGDKVSLILPDFTKSVAYIPVSDHLVQSLFFEAEETLIMTILQDVFARQRVCHTPVGLSVPPLGIRSYYEGIEIATDSPSGPVRRIAVRRIPKVGAFKMSSMSFDRALAGAGILITIQLTPLMNIESGQNIQVKLPGYHRGSSATIAGCTSVSSCSWNDNTQILSVVNQNSVAELGTFSFSIPKSSGIRLPVDGVRPDVSTHTIAVQSSYGDVNPTQIISVQSVGSFSNTRLEFNPKPPVTRIAIEISIRFTYINDFEVGDEVKVLLPGFHTDERVNIDVIRIEGIDASSWAQGTWIQDKEWLQLTASKPIAAGTESYITIPQVTTPARIGIFPPEEGSLVNNTLLLILTQVPQGPVLPTSIEMSDAIGSLGAFISVEFGQPKTTYATDVIFKFVSGMILDEDDIITIFLNHFTLSEVSTAWSQGKGKSQDVGPNVFRQFIFDVVVKEVNTLGRKGVELTLEPTANIPLNSPLFISIPVGAGISIPFGGVTPNDPAHKIKATFAAGILPERSFDVVPSIGAFETSEISYSPRKVRSAIEITLVIATLMTIKKGEDLVIHLPGFAARGPMGPADVAEGIVTSNPEKYFRSENGQFNCRWVRNRATMSLSVSEDLPAHVVVTILYPLKWSAMRAVGGVFEVHVDNTPTYMRLPNEGIETNDERYMISTAAAEGPVLPSPIQSVMGVMAINGEPGVTFSRAMPFAPSAVTLVFESTLKLQTGDTVTMILPGFSACACETCNDLSPCDADVNSPTRNTSLNWFSKCNCNEKCQQPGIFRVEQQDVSEQLFEDTAIWHQAPRGYVSGRLSSGEMCVACGIVGSCYASRVTFTIKNETIEPRTALEVRLPEGFVRLPVDGISSALNPILIQTETEAGVLTPFPLAVNNPFPGLITDMSLEFGVPVAASVSDITFRFRLNAPAKRGSKLILSLPSFIRDERWTQTVSMEDQRATYTETFEMLCTTASRSTIHFGGLCDANDETCCEPSPLDHASRIIEYSGTTRPIVSSIDGKVLAIFENAEWDPKKQKIILELTKDLPFDPSSFAKKCVVWAGALEISVTVPSSAAIRVPVSGLSANNSYVSASFELNMPGTISTTESVVNDIPEVQPLFHSSKIAFKRTTRSLDTDVEINIEFTMSTSLKDSYTIQVFLPGFSKAEGTLEQNVNVCFDKTNTTLNTFDNTCGSMSARQGKATWDEIESRLALTGLMIDLPSVLVKIVISTEAGIKRPFTGVDESSGLMLAVRVDNRETNSLLELRKSFDEEERILVISSVSLDFMPRVVGRPTSVSVEYTLSFDLMSGDTVTIVLPGFTGPDLSSIHNVRSTLTCSIPRELGLFRTNIENCAEKTYNFEGAEICKEGGLCRPDWYGPKCESYCNDLDTCNAHRGLGFCNVFGTCTCFPPNNGRFCNSTQQVPHEENCGALVPMAHMLPEQSISFTGSWSQSTSAVTLTVAAPRGTRLAAGTRVNISMTTDGSEDSGIFLPVAGLPSSAGDMVLQVAKKSSPTAAPETVSSSRIEKYADVLQFRCRVAVLDINAAPLCTGLHTVRVCARSQADAGAYAQKVVKPLLEKITTSTCLDETCGVGGALTQRNKQSCCMVRSVGDLGTCASDVDCASIDTRTQDEEKGVPLVEEPCCSFCNKTLSKWCQQPVEQCSSCSKSTPCAGFKLTNDVLSLESGEGGVVRLDSGSGVIVPLGVWPLDEDLVISVYSLSLDTAAVADATMVSEALFFGPTGTRFREPGIQLNFQIDPDVASPPDGFRIAAFKIVNGVPVEHPFTPVVNRVTGQVSVKTLSFSAYVLMQVPVVIEQTPRPALPVIPIDPPSSVTDEFLSRDDAQDGSDNQFANPRSPLFLAVVGLSVLALICASFFAYGKYVKLYRATSSKTSLLLGEHSYRMQEENEPMAEDVLVLGTDLITTDGTEISPPSPRIEGGDVERIFSIADGMDEKEPPVPSRLALPGVAAMNLQNMLGSVGLIGTGARVTRGATARPMPSEVQSTLVMGEDKIEMTADLVVLDHRGEMDGASQDMEESEPIMEEAEAQDSWGDDMKKEPYYGQEFEMLSSSGAESNSTPGAETPVAPSMPSDLSMPFEGEDQEEAEPFLQEIPSGAPERIEPEPEEIEPEQVEILHDTQADSYK